MTIQQVSKAIQSAPEEMRCDIFRELSSAGKTVYINGASQDDIISLASKLNVICKAPLGLDLIRLLIAKDDDALVAKVAAALSTR